MRLATPSSLSLGLFVGVLAAASALWTAPAAAQSASISPELRARLTATKKKADMNRVAQVYAVENGVPVLKLQSGRKVPLTTLGPSPVLSAAARAKGTPPPSMSKYKPYVDKPGVETLAEQPTIVALRIDHTSRQSPIRDQGSRGTCTGFATTAAIEAFYRWKTGTSEDLSEQALYKRMKDVTDQTCDAYGSWYASAIEALSSPAGKMCTEAQQPYVTQPPIPCPITPACIAGAKYVVNGLVHLPRYADGMPASQSPRNTRLIESYLAEGFDVAIGLDMAGTDWSDGTEKTGVVDVQLDASGNPLPKKGAHAMLIVGFDRPGGFFTLKNSWGTDYGRDGYVRVSYDYVQTYGLEGMVVTDATVERLMPTAATPATPTTAPATTPTAAPRVLKR